MLIPSYAPLVGGAEVQLSEIVKRLDRRRVAPFVLTRRLPGTPEHEVVDDTPIIRLPSSLRGSFFLQVVNYLRTHTDKYDVVHTFSMDSPATAAAIAKQASGRRIIQRIPRFGPGSAMDKQSQTALGRARLRFVIRQADRLMPLCRDAHDELTRLGTPASKIVSIPNGVDTTLFAPAPSDEKSVLKQSLGIHPDVFVAITVSRLIIRKQIGAAITHWAQTQTSRPSVLVIVGDGPEEDALREHARRVVSDPDRVIFVGGSSRSEIVKLLKTADAYLSFSKSEGMSNAMLEAMAVGLPIVAARASGIEDTVNHLENGFIFDATEPAQATAYLNDLINSPATLMSMSRSSRARAKLLFSFEGVIDRLATLYKESTTREPEPV